MTYMMYNPYVQYITQGNAVFDGKQLIFSVNFRRITPRVRARIII